MFNYGIQHRNVTIHNAANYGSGWTLDAQGQLSFDGMIGYQSEQIDASWQPMGTRRIIAGDGYTVVEMFRMWVYPNAAGVFPTIRGREQTQDNGYLPTLVERYGRTYVTYASMPWSGQDEALLPHIEVDVYLVDLSGQRSATQAEDNGDGDTVVY